MANPVNAPYLVRSPFLLRRYYGVTGVTGQGDIAEGAHFSDGSVALCWKPQPDRGVTKSSIALWPDVVNMLGIHGHDGKTEIAWQTLSEVIMPLETFTLAESELGVMVEGVKFSNGTVATTRPAPHPWQPSRGQLPGLMTVWPNLEVLIDDASVRRQTVTVTWDRV